MTAQPAPAGPSQPQPGVQRLTLPLQRVWLTYVLLATIGAVFLGQLALAPMEGDVDPIINWGAKVNILIAAGQIWRLVTPIFIHASLTHFLFNAYALYLFGRRVESAYGAVRLFVLFFFSGIGGTIASLWLSPSVSVGASGAIFGLFAAEAVLLWRNRALLGAYANSRLNNLLLMAVLNLVIALAPGSQIDLWAHIGGALTGALMAAWIGPIWRVVPSEVSFGQREIRDAQSLTSLRIFGVFVLSGGLLALALGYIVLARLYPGLMAGLIG